MSAPSIVARGGPRRGRAACESARPIRGSHGRLDVEVREIPAVVGDKYFHEVFFSDVRVPVSYRLGPEHEGWDVVTYALACERVGSARYARAALTLDALAEEARRRGRLSDPVLQEKLAKVCAQPGRRLGFCFHSLRAVTRDEIQAVLASANDDRPVHIHIAEQQKEVDDCLAWSKRRPIQWLYDNVAVNERWCLIHATHAESDEVAAMVKSRAIAGKTIIPSAQKSLYAAWWIFRPRPICPR